ncbi:MAG: energy-coupling factor transporter transmembrane protein EcfT, partial [Desulfobacterales bacterium]|nr:energy-coupling factor transporter transmembrane protein EcfT [Desulfobacterales bacterium]
MDLTGKRGNLFQELDPRMKFILVVFFTVFTFMVDSTGLFMYYYGLILVLFFASRLYRKGIKVLIFITVMLLIQALGEGIQSKAFR